MQLQRFSRGFLARRRVKEKRQQQRPLGDQEELGIDGWNPCKKMVNLGHLGAWSTNYHFLCVFLGSGADCDWTLEGNRPTARGPQGEPEEQGASQTMAAFAKSNGTL